MIQVKLNFEVRGDAILITRPLGYYYQCHTLIDGKAPVGESLVVCLEDVPSLLEAISKLMIQDA